MSDLPLVIKGMELSADLIVSDMNRAFPKIRVRCTVCNHTQFASWSYLKTGWPKHHDLTMRLESDDNP